MTTARPVGGGGGRRGGGWGGGGGRWGRGGGQPPPPQISLPQWLLEALGPTSAAARKAAMVTWSAHSLQEGCARDQPLFSGASHAHMTLEWVFRRLVWCQICRHGENKGTWRRDSEQGGACTWRPLPGEPLSPVPEGINVGSLSSLNLCGDPGGVRFGTAYFYVALQHWVTLGWCRQWGKGVHFAVQWTAVLAPPRPVYDPAAQHQYEGSRGGTRNAATAFAKAAVPAAADPPPPPPPPTCRGGPYGLHTLSDSHGGCPGAGSADWF